MSGLATARRAVSRLRWFIDWRLYATLAASVVAGVLFFVVLDSSRGRDDALEALKAQAAQAIDTREALSRRIDVLEEQGAEQIAQIIALRDQLTAAGVTPVVAEPARPRSAEKPQRPPAPTTTSSTTTTTRPRPPTTTTTAPPCTTVPVLERCV